MRLGFLEISLAISTLTSFFEKICIRKAKSIGQISMKSWLREIYESLRMRIRMEKRININKDG
jgi:hypothetical protein